MVEIKDGNLLEAKDVDIILHQVNCMGVMGGGIAKQIKNRYPYVYEEYLAFCQERTDRLGEILICETPDFLIVNCFGQYGYGTLETFTNYEALRECFNKVAKLVKTAEKDHNRHVRIGMPYKIGCGLAGGDWQIVYKIICEEFNDLDVVLYAI